MTVLLVGLFIAGNTSCGKTDDGGGTGTVTPPEPPVTTTDEYPENPSFGAPGSNYAALMNYFTDATCSKVRSDYSLDALNGIEDEFFRNLAKSLWYWQNDSKPASGESSKVIAYNPTHHVIEVQAYLKPSVVSNQNKTAPYGRMDNASAIHVAKSENVVVFVEKLDVAMTLLVINPQREVAMSYGSMVVQTVNLNAGFNTFKAADKGMLYFVYHTDNASWKTMKSLVHVACGVYNGIYVKGKTDPAKWKTILDNATFGNLDLIGDYTHAIMPLKNLKQSVPDPEKLIAAYDEMAYEEQNFSGLVKYDRMNPTRMTMVGGSFSSHMFAAWAWDSSFTGYSLESMGEIMPVENFKSSGVWGPAHEMGHVNQLRPALRWSNGGNGGNLGEVSNNIFTLYMQTLWGNKSRLLTEMTKGQNQYDTAYRRFFVEGRLTTDTDGGEENVYNNVFNRLIPFWQLYLYFTKAGKYTGDAPEDFYKDLMENLRNDTSYSGYSAANDSQMRYCLDRFAWHVSRVAKTNMVDFFNDYGFALSTDMVNTINNLGYAAPALAMRYINDENVALYKTPAAAAAGTAVMTSTGTNSYSVSVKSDSKNVVAYEVYTSTSPSAKPIHITMLPQFSFMTSASRTSIVIKAVGVDGARQNVTITA